MSNKRQRLACEFEGLSLALQGCKMAIQDARKYLQNRMPSSHEYTLIMEMKTIVDFFVTEITSKVSSQILEMVLASCSSTLAKYLPNKFLLYLASTSRLMTKILVPITRGLFYSCPVAPSPRMCCVKLQSDESIGTLPPSITQLILSEDFNSPITTLPISLTHLTFGAQFNCQVGKLPATITHLTFGIKFNCEVNNLPPSVTHLSFGYLKLANNENEHNFGCFNQSITDLPHSLISLSIYSEEFNQPLHKLPPLITSLCLVCPNCQFPVQFPHLLEEISINLRTSALPKLPLSTKLLEISGSFYKPIILSPQIEHVKLCRPIEIQNVPDSLTSLALPRLSPTLPPSITHLSLGVNIYFKFNDLVNTFPSHLSHLSFGNYFNQPVDHLPTSLVQVSFGKRFNQPVVHLPLSLKKIIFGEQFNQKVDHLPPSLTYLAFGGYFNQPIDHLPSTIQNLTLGLDFAHHVHQFPSSLTHLILCEPRFTMWFPAHLQELHIHQYSYEYEEPHKSHLVFYLQQHSAVYMKFPEWDD
eukprot:Phypoly_transcript_05459.p1 GENE.Phypoly_transcript_05459~~Phypoly_transcript_05459.p1  ORF type:complete len:528 (+),score=40.98 Phypoly_transcript_05459:211-1794(+)